jgi:hypothetical protein
MFGCLASDIKRFQPRSGNWGCGEERMVMVLRGSRSPVFESNYGTFPARSWRGFIIFIYVQVCYQSRSGCAYSQHQRPAMIHRTARSSLNTLRGSVYPYKDISLHSHPVKACKMDYSKLPTPSHCTADFCLIPVRTSPPQPPYLSALVAPVAQLYPSTITCYCFNLFLTESDRWAPLLLRSPMK